MRKKQNQVICNDVNGHRVCHTEWLSQKEKRQCIYMESRKFLPMNPFAGQEQRNRCRKWTCEHSGKKRMDELRVQH